VILKLKKRYEAENLKLFQVYYFVTYSVTTIIYNWANLSVFEYMDFCKYTLQDLLTIVHFTSIHYLLGECLNSLRSLPLVGLPPLAPGTYFCKAGGGMRRLLSGDFTLVLNPPGERRDIRGGGGVVRRLGDLDRIILKKGNRSVVNAL
jgi:hypothetical protein